MNSTRLLGPLLCGLLVLAIVGCDANAPAADAPLAPSLVAEAPAAKAGLGPAVIVNPGNGQPNGFCNAGGFSAERVTGVLTPSGRGTLSCHFDDVPPVRPAQRFSGFNCTLFAAGGPYTTTNSRFVRTPGGTAQLTCQFR